MSLGLCMAVKDEAHQLVDCLSPLMPVLDQIAIVDTGSRDGTPQLLEERFGIRAAMQPIDDRRCRCLCDARDTALDQLSTEWVLMLDADERIDPEILAQFKRSEHDADTAGYFGRWLNPGVGEADFEDYKLFLFRHGLRPMGLVHDVVQLDIRARGLHAQWWPGLDVQHRPDIERNGEKAARYRERLHCAIEQQPEFYRYHWFLGYMEYREQRIAQARQWLRTAANAEARAFPVECLNSAMVLAELYAREGDDTALGRTLQQARALYTQVQDDFEVRVNFRLGPWLEAAWRQYCEGQWDRIQAYRFAC